MRAELALLRELTNYEAFTCVAGDGGLHGAETRIDRDGAGRAVYSWKPGAERLHAGRLRELTRAGRLQPGEAWLQLRDVETDAFVAGGRGSVFWNDYRRRWVMIVSGQAGEVWFSEADTPTGPWVYARLIAVHGRYNFYNPTQHPFFDQDGGRLIYFEGTYTASFSGAPVKTPRYDYNQLMYRLALDDARLGLPAPVYRVRQADGSRRYGMREGVEAEQAWGRIEEIAFFAMPPERPRDGLVAVYFLPEENRFQTAAPPGASRPLFFALPEGGGGSSPALASMAIFVSGEQDPPRCRVWKNPMTALALSFETRPVMAKKP